MPNLTKTLRSLPIQNLAKTGLRSLESLDEEPFWENAKPYTEMPGPKPLPFLGNTWRFIPFIGKCIL